MMASQAVPMTEIGPVDKRKHPEETDDASGIAAYLLDRRGVLDRTLSQQDRSSMGSILNRTPPSPVALVAVETAASRDRLVRLLRNANIEFDEARGVGMALATLGRDTNAVLFTDQIDLIQRARHLPAGAATHIVFVNPQGAMGSSEAWRAGANDCMPAQPGGEEFWAHLTTARRIIGLASSLKVALTDNRILSTVDALTGSGSRRFFEREFPREFERAVRLRRPLTLVMCDIDHFKRVNDQRGHQVGDEVLSEFGDRLSQGLRLGFDWLARVGGEEFAVVLPDTSEEEGSAIAERLRERVAASPFETRAGKIVVTASFGACGTRGRRESPMTADALLEAADAALYRSKRGGRNRVTRAAVSE